MSTIADLRPRAGVLYPEDDGEPMADNTLQFQWIVTIEGGLDALFRDDPNVFVAGNLLWYPVEGDNRTRAAPDAMVAFGRPKGHRGSYMQWAEGGIAPQVVFEVLSPGNRLSEMIRKLRFYERHGVEEYYLYDPDGRELTGWLRAGAVLQEIESIEGWVSPRLGTRFELHGGELKITGPDGRPFATYIEVVRQREEIAAERDHVMAERDQLRRERQEEQQRYERLAARLRSMGVDPEE